MSDRLKKPNETSRQIWSIDFPMSRNMSLTVLADKEDLQTHQVKFHPNQDPSIGCNSQKEAKNKKRKSTTDI